MDRDVLINFCVDARAELEGIRNIEDKAAMRGWFEGMTQEQLEFEADWLDDMLGK